MENLASKKFEILTADSLRHIAGGELANTGPGKHKTGKTRIVNGVTQEEWQDHSADNTDPKTRHTTYQNLGDPYWV